MKILTDPLYEFTTGEQLNPNRLNGNLSYVEDACDDVFSRRYADSVITFKWFSGYNNAYTDAQVTGIPDLLKWRLPAPQALTITGMYLYGALYSGTAYISLYDNATGAAPAGVTNPIFTVQSNSVDQTYVRPLQMPAGAQWYWSMTGTSFNSRNLHMSVVIRTDRFGSGDVKQDPSVAYVTENDAINATTYNSQVSGLETVISNNTAYQAALKATLYCDHWSSSSYNSTANSRPVPLVDSSKYRCTATRLDLFTVQSGNGSGSDSVTVTLNNAAGASTGLAATASVVGVSYASASDTSPAVSLTGSSGVESVTGSDYNLVLTSTNAAGRTYYKSYYYLWTY